MCGIFGIVRGTEATLPPDLFRRTADRLFLLSESRGKESAGVALNDGTAIHVYKQPIPASRLIRTPVYEKLLGPTLRACEGDGNGSPRRHAALIGHSRLVTNGVQNDNDNNQPVVARGLVGIHNGIVVNDAELWARFPTLERRHEVDTEVILELLHHFDDETGSERRAACATFGAIEGCASIAVLFEDRDALLLATNNASLYLCESESAPIVIFASELYMLRKLLNDRQLAARLGAVSIRRFAPGEACLVDFADASVLRFDLASDADATNGAAEPPHTDARAIRDVSPAVTLPPRAAFGGGNESLLFEGKEGLAELRRCTRCILPETFPFLEFDDEGVCTFCRHDEPFVPTGHAALEAAAAPFRRTDGRPDCLVGVSGGRDSCWGLHYIVRELGMTPIAYTYDWGMVTDLARRNISRMCATLGVEHILVSADIAWKRANVRRNVTAWLERPDLGMIPLFTAGDKQFYYHANRLSKQNDIDFFIFCAGNRYEQTDFKTGFCGLGRAEGGILNSLKMRDKLGLLRYYGGQFLRNPRYLNRSLADTAGAFFASYLMPHDYVYLFHCIPWDEDSIMQTLRDEYDWEVADDTIATWRIGDGTAAFYNYIYHTVAGFTEFDTFRSNQIRAGAITRDAALAIVEQENRPRYEALCWYFDAIRMTTSFDEIISRINAIPKLYPTA